MFSTHYSRYCSSAESTRIQKHLEDYYRYERTPTPLSIMGRSKSKKDSSSPTRLKTDRKTGESPASHLKPITPRHSSRPKTQSSKDKDKDKDKKPKSAKPDDKAKSARPVMDTEVMKGRREITAVTMNMSGQGVLGMTPAYKINLIRTFLESMPDVVFFQDSIEQDDLRELLKTVSDDKYTCYFQEMMKPEKPDKKRDDDRPPPPQSGLVWHSEKYHGTPLELEDKRLGDLAKWVAKHNITVVKLDSMQKVGIEDVYPSFIAISWHGKDYETPLRHRIQELEDFIDFVIKLRENNWMIPILVGGDFNMDMKSFDLERYKDLLLVPYRPISGKNAKDFKNTFLFTMDALQVIETHYKQFHPEVFSSPWIIIKIKGRNQLKIWAIVRIQRCFRKFIQRQRVRREGEKKTSETKERWKKKLQGEDYRPPSPEKEKPKKETDWTGEDEKQELSSEEFARRRRKSFSEDGDFYKSLVTKENQFDSHRRKRFGDLKSVQERRAEQAELDAWDAYRKS